MQLCLRHSGDLPCFSSLIPAWSEVLQEVSALRRQRALYVREVLTTAWLCRTKTTTALSSTFRSHSFTIQQKLLSKVTLQLMQKRPGAAACCSFTIQCELWKSSPDTAHRTRKDPSDGLSQHKLSGNICSSFNFRFLSTFKPKCLCRIKRSAWI